MLIGIALHQFAGANLPTKLNIKYRETWKQALNVQKRGKCAFFACFAFIGFSQFSPSTYFYRSVSS
jgi:hypothetical protein